MKDKEVAFLSFADSRFQSTLARLRREVIESNMFDNVWIHDESDLKKEILSEIKRRFNNNKRGFGYWLWKPFLILQKLKLIENNSILVYADAGCHVRGNRQRLRHYINLLEEEHCGILSFQKPYHHELTGKENYYLERRWTKMDTFFHFGLHNNPIIMDTPQIVSGVLIIKKNSESIDILKRWYRIMYDHFELVNDDTSARTNHSGFIENRHDQSILSLLLKKQDAKVLGTEEIEGDKALFNDHPILALRDIGGRLHYKKFMVHKYIRIIKNPTVYLNFLLNREEMPQLKKFHD